MEHSHILQSGSLPNRNRVLGDKQDALPSLTLAIELQATFVSVGHAVLSSIYLMSKEYCKSCFIKLDEVKETLKSQIHLGGKKKPSACVVKNKHQIQSVGSNKHSKLPISIKLVVFLPLILLPPVCTSNLSVASCAWGIQVTIMGGKYRKIYYIEKRFCSVAMSSEELSWAMLQQILQKVTMEVTTLLCTIAKWPAVVLPEVWRIHDLFSFHSSQKEMPFR